MRVKDGLFGKVHKITHSLTLCQSKGSTAVLVSQLQINEFFGIQRQKAIMIIMYE